MAILRTLKNAILGARYDLRRVDSLRSNLEALGDIPSEPKASLEYLVRFCNTVSVFQDDGNVYLNDKKLSFRLNCAIRKAGRNPFGINKSKKGEEVTLDDIWIGNVGGQFVHKASWWIQSNDTYLEELANQAVIPFLYSNRTEILKLCKDILKS